MLENVLEGILAVYMINWGPPMICPEITHIVARFAICESLTQFRGEVFIMRRTEGSNQIHSTCYIKSVICVSSGLNIHGAYDPCQALMCIMLFCELPVSNCFCLPHLDLLL